MQGGRDGKSWFAALFGAEEAAYSETQALFSLESQDGEELLVAPNARRFHPGCFETRSLGELRSQMDRVCKNGQALHVQNVVGDVRAMHSHRESGDAVFQVASQFNCLEFLNPTTVPEDGVANYELDHTQGPSCALACAASTVWRNYFMTFEGGCGAPRGQTRDRQLNTLKDVIPFFDEDILEVRNGYTFSKNVEALAAKVESMHEEDKDALRAACRVGVQWNAEVTDAPPTGWPPHCVTQVFCSALALGSSPKLRLWRPFAQLVLDAAYEATLSVAAINLARGGSRDVYLTLLGSGAFGNGPKWIEGALRRALCLHACSGLRVFVVHLSDRTPWMAAYRSLVSEWGALETLILKHGVWSPLSLEQEDSQDEEDPVDA